MLVRNFVDCFYVYIVYSLVEAIIIIVKKYGPLY